MEVIIVNIIEDENKNIIVEQSAKIGHETRKAKNKAGKEKVYKIKIIRLPELVRSFFNDYVYIYDMDGTSYITSDEPVQL